jgi:hypothetical protein
MFAHSIVAVPKHSKTASALTRCLKIQLPFFLTFAHIVQFQQPPIILLGQFRLRNSSANSSQLNRSRDNLSTPDRESPRPSSASGSNPVWNAYSGWSSPFRSTGAAEEDASRRASPTPSEDFIAPISTQSRRRSRSPDNLEFSERLKKQLKQEAESIAKENKIPAKQLLQLAEVCPLFSYLYGRC